MEQDPNGSWLETPQAFSKRLKLQFKDSLLLTRALTHRSYLNEHPSTLEDNERLEYLGDAVLDFLVAGWLYNRYPEMAEGDLTRLRSSFVQTERLADFARKIELGKALRLGRGEVQNGGRNRSALLCDAFEALIGALYLGNDIKVVQDFISQFLEEAEEKILLNHRFEDPKSLLQEWAQANGFETPTYRTKSSSGPEHSKSFVVEVTVDGKIWGSGIGRSKQSAEKAAAHDALEKQGII
ncbi:MAG: ribonuclease III [Anaerolineaceae bacterium]|nr:ribonuclease III [Anaerolineaceae bacterium]